MHSHVFLLEVIVGIGHLAIGIGRIGRLFVLVSKTKNAFNCSSHWWQWGN